MFCKIIAFLMKFTAHMIYFLAVITVGIVQNKLKTAYKHICNSDNPHCYIQLALVLDEICNIHDERLNKTTRHTLQGQVDEISKIKEPLKRGLKDIFHYNDLPCPRLILVVGAQGIKTKCIVVVCICTVHYLVI